jgi:Protein of unknown function DUF2625
VEQSAWSEISALVAAAPYPVEVLPADPQQAAACLAALEIATGSWFGAVVANSGGLVIDHGWLRVLGALTGFYEGLRWPGWEAEVASVALDQGISAWPPPWTREGKDLSAVSRKPIRLVELVSVHQDAARQLGFR